MHVSSPLKLKNTSYMHWWLKEEEDAPLLVRRVIAIWIYRQWRRSERKRRKKYVTKLEMFQEFQKEKRMKSYKEEIFLNVFEIEEWEWQTE